MGKLILSFCILALVLFVNGCVSENEIGIDSRMNITSCEKDSDCVKVARGCCVCGGTIAINKDYVENYTKNLSLFCKDKSCIAVACQVIPSYPKCVNNTCKEYQYISNHSSMNSTIINNICGNGFCEEGYKVTIPKKEKKTITYLDTDYSVNLVDMNNNLSLATIVLYRFDKTSGWGKGKNIEVEEGKTYLVYNLDIYVDNMQPFYEPYGNLSIPSIVLKYGENNQTCPEDCGYSCPEKKSVSCMPAIAEEDMKYCLPPYHEWIIENCNISFSY